MGIRALVFVKSNEYKNDPIVYLNKLKDELFRLGAFGFESWHCRVTSAKKDNSNDIVVNMFQFMDNPECNAVLSKKETIIGDSAFLKNIGSIGFTKKNLLVKIEGSMAQIGDFKVRYGITSFKDKQIGILIDLEYLPITSMSVDFKLIFNGFLSLIGNKSDLVYTQSQNDAEYKFIHLISTYQQVFKDNEIVIQ